MYAFIARTFLLLLIVSGTNTMAQNQCIRPGNDAPCLPGGLTSATQTEPTLNAGAGNPVHLATGHKVHLEQDGPFRRHYHANSKATGGILGRAWSIDWETHLRVFEYHATIVHADASRTHFTRKDKQAEYTGPTGRLKKHDKHWLWQDKSGQKLTFNLKGQLIQIQNRQLDLSVLRYTNKSKPLQGLAHTLVLNGRRIKLQYDIQHNQAVLSEMRTGNGVIRYRYITTSAQVPILHQVSWPNGEAHRYHYLAGIAGHSGTLIGVDKRFAPNAPFKPWRHWTLDTHGRVSFIALHHLHQAKQPTTYLAFNYLFTTTPSQNGVTYVTQTNGRQTRFLFKWVNGRARLHSVSGDPCPGCAAPGTRAQYTRYGELKTINGLHIHRNQQGHIQHLSPQHSGWPHLQLHFNGKGQLQRWYSSLTGHTVLGRTPNGMPKRLTFANGDHWNYNYDGAGRPVEIVVSGTNKTPIVTTLQWRGNRLTRVQHPNETLIFEYDLQGRRVAQQSSRMLQSGLTTLKSRFAYNKQNQRIRHDLPEGGHLHYVWQGKRLQKLVWENTNGVRNTVVQAPPLPLRTAGYQYGNGLRTYTTVGPKLAHQRLQAQTKSGRQLTVWQQQYRLNAQGQVVEELLADPLPQRWLYAHDRRQRLIGAKNSAGPTTKRGPSVRTQWYAWHNSGALMAAKRAGKTHYPNIQRDPSGLPLRINKARLEYGPDRRLKSVNRGASIQYQHNAFGQLIERHTPGPNGPATESFWYLDGQRVAEQHSALAPFLSRRYLYVQQVPVGFIQYSHQYPNGQLYFIHSDLLGAPRLVTNTRQKVLWLANYTPTGHANIEIEQLALNLRLPGQHADPYTGWHDNLHRTYDPQAGHYLEPDPLGPFPGGDALGYASQQPRRYIDPLGLMLFAFDGTRNNAQTQSNVWKLAQRYEGGPVFYQSGPGNPYTTDWDALTAYSAPDIINKQWQNLLQSLQSEPVNPNNMQPIDILGYSRGGAMARHFANQVSQYTTHNLFSFHDPLRGLISACVDLRFLGLFDTVAQFGIGGSRNDEFNFTINDSWQWVAHAIALHEHRWLFPLMTTGESPGMNTVEAPFVGAHADIGGGIVIDEKGQ
ncbi:MAG: hypothetical protein CML17_06045, partial [Pusillimonas sp.]|nr:hypothetical protein [Pusillimonas sp.]